MKKATAGMLIEQIEKLSYLVQDLENRIKAAENTLAARNPDGYQAYQVEIEKYAASHPNRPFIQRMEDILELIAADSEKKKVKRKAAGQ
jgi:hypothetical protein